MGVRYYPNEEGYCDKTGKPYPDWPEGTIREELAKFLSALRDGCHKRNWGLVVESLNHGQHTGNSMHFKGLAIDFNCYLMNSDGKNLRTWCSFEDQQSLVEEAAAVTGYDVWCWTADLNTHTHASCHP